ncbi:VirB4 family type IV secretion/conjugal transfer ATPase [Photobacterium damselae]|uniref:VirB4 family type IV secretion/conjugal transfer ATPase n=2 Tax=Photobacterium damselae TaxID=38293 RepID=UPI001EFDCDB5|nr:VirB4 family type IV secretion/conjugal transfer ATPase [Photobacterium damselae]MCG9706499.1 VirB4 family type IV secretion/conjugal transfer ATPase [Photobacterium damselae]
MIPSRNGRLIEHERAIAAHIPYSSHIDTFTLKTKDNALVRVFELSGISFETKGDDDITRLHNSLNELLKSFSDSSLGIWTHIIRATTDTTIDGEFDHHYAKELNQRYQSQFDNHVRANRLFITLALQSDSKLTRLYSKDKILDYINAQNQILTDIAINLTQALKHYHVRPLSCFKHQDHLCSEPLSLFNYLMCGQWEQIRLPHGPVDFSIGSAWLYMGSDAIEIQHVTGKCFAQGLDIKSYPNDSFPGMLNGLLYSDFDFVLTQSFTLFTMQKAAKEFKLDRTRMSNVDDDGESQIEAITDALDMFKNGVMGAGEYHFSLFVFGQTLLEAKNNRGKAAKLLADVDIQAVTINIALDAAFFAQLPANWRYRPRVVKLTTRNFAGLSPFSNFIMGKMRGNPWGAAVTRIKSISHLPYYFNFHLSPLGVNSIGDTPLGNTLLIGQSGQGKSVFLSLLLSQSQKFGAHGQAFSSIFFDKDRGCEVMIRALDGAYVRIESGKPTGMNPFQIEPTPANVLWLKEWVASLVEDEHFHLSDDDKEQLSITVDLVLNQPKPVRRLSLFAQFVTERIDREGQAKSFKRRLAPWLAGGDYGWVFDCDLDVIDFNLARNVGVDGTVFLDNDKIRAPIVNYLLHRLNDVIDGRRLVCMFDEGWKWVQDDIVSSFINDKQVTIRKLNGVMVSSTQYPKQFLDSKVADALILSTTTQIFLPNPKAEFKEYQRLGLTQTEFDLLASFGDGSRLCLIKQGEQSLVCTLALPSSMQEDLFILSAGKQDLPFLDEAMAERPGDSSQWLPLYIEKVKAARARKKELSLHV